MKITKLAYDQIPAVGGRDKAYISEVPALRPFFKYPVDIEAFAQVVEDKKKDKIDRKTLMEVLESQHEGYELPALLQQNIESLSDENTFTIVTAHQPSLFTGPLYYVFKIISAINLAKTLNGRYPQYRFVPVFITSGEDHDFEEVNHLHLFNKTLTWESGESGQVGMMKTETLRPVLDELKNVLGDSENAQKIFAILERAHTQNDLYHKAAFEVAHELFKQDGLVVLNSADARLKRLFIPIIREEILEQTSYSIVNETIRKIEAAGFSTQAPPREINFFYLSPQSRERIVKEDGVFKVLNTGLVFSEEEMLSEIENHPERFSPNVVMRPLFQETILPNLAYVGGGGEIAYWLERKRQFEHFGLNFPMLVRRNSAMWVDSTSAKRMEKLGLSLNDIWADTDVLIKNYLLKNATSEFQLQEEKAGMAAVFQRIAEKTEVIDATLVKAVWAEHAKTLKTLEQMESRLVRAEKQKHDHVLQQIKSLKEKLFPGNGLQERFDNFLPFYVKYGESFFDVLKEHFDPLEKTFLVVEDCG